MPPELWWPPVFHRLLLLGLLLSLFFISLTLGSILRNLAFFISSLSETGKFFSPWIPNTLIFAKTQKPRSAMCQQASGEIVWMNTEMTLNLCSTLRWQVLFFPTTPQHTCFLLDQEMFYCVFFFPLFTFSTTLLHGYFLLILCLSLLFWKINQKAKILGQKEVLGRHLIQTLASK